MKLPITIKVSLSLYKTFSPDVGCMWHARGFCFSDDLYLKELVRYDYDDYGRTTVERDSLERESRQ